MLIFFIFPKAVAVQVLTVKRKMSGSPKLLWTQFPSLLWNFTESNFLTFVLPNTMFGLFSSLAAPSLTDCHQPPTVTKLSMRWPLVLIFNWGSVFVFDLANQRHPESLQEDRLNKPWRPIPMNRISSDSARRLLLGAIPVVLSFNCFLGVANETAYIFSLTWLYNDLRGGDNITRDPIIAVAYGLFLSSSLRIALGSGCIISERGYKWIFMQCGVILTTMQVQDLKDQEGDRARGRVTIPLLVGDMLSRWSIAWFILLWSIGCAYFWNLSLRVYMLPLAVGAWVGVTVVRRKDDAWAWKCWCIWLVTLYRLSFVPGCY